MVNVLDLPPELLHEIFIVPFDLNRLDPYEDHLSRSRDLSSFSLVHSRWRVLAQPLLAEKVWARRARCYQVISGIAKPPFKTSTVRSLTFDSALSVFMGATEEDDQKWRTRWKEIVQLRLLRDSWGGNSGALTLSHLERFTNLETLYLTGMSVFLGSSNYPNIRLPRLRRLVLDGNTTFTGDIASCHHLFSPSTLPSLIHLALDALHRDRFTLEKIFEKILPQVESVAISNRFSGRDYTTLIEPLVGLSNLRHLSLGLTWRWDSRPLLFDVPKHTLTSLHLSYQSLAHDAMTETNSYVGYTPLHELMIGTFYIYGRRNPQAQELEQACFGSRNTVWIEDTEFPPFANFDGSVA